MLSSQRKDVIKIRTTSLQQYIRKLLDDEELMNDSNVKTFFDAINMGKSGASLDLPGGQILLETIGSVKRGIFPAQLWYTYFFVLTKQGTIYILRSVYDSISTPLVAFPISSSVHIVPHAGTAIVELTNRIKNDVLILKFANDMDVAKWLRSFAEFTTRNIDNPEEGKETISSSNNNSKSRQSARISQQINAAAEEEKGKNQQADDLSALYGV
jgi:hypothetical protein